MIKGSIKTLKCFEANNYNKMVPRYLNLSYYSRICPNILALSSILLTSYYSHKYAGILASPLSVTTYLLIQKQIIAGTPVRKLALHL